MALIFTVMPKWLNFRNQKVVSIFWEIKTKNTYFTKRLKPKHPKD